MKPNDQDLLDVLLDDAPEAVRARVAAAAADPASPAHQAPWAELLRATRESRAAATRHQHIIEATLARLQAEAPAPSVATASRRWANPIVATASRRWAAAALAATVLLLTGIGFHALRLSAGAPPQQLAQTETGVNGSRYVDFAAPANGDGTPAAPYRTLGEALDHAPAEGVLRITAGASPEPLRLEKRIRIESVNGKVHLGAS